MELSDHVSRAIGRAKVRLAPEMTLLSHNPENASAKTKALMFNYRQAVMRENQSLGLLTRSDTNRSVQSQKARS